MSEYKLIACDLDGTLMRDDMSISEENLRAISEIAVRGVEFVPCTGRTLCEIPEAVRCHPDVRWIIHSNGAVILDRHTGQSMKLCMTREQSRRALNILGVCEAHITVRQAGQSWASPDEQTARDYAYYRVYPAHQRVLADYAQFPANYRTMIYEMDDVEVISAFFHSDEEMENCREALSATGELRAASLGGVNLEIFSSFAGKGRALRCLGQLLGIDVRAIIGMGDSGNDIPLMEGAGLGLAVANACDALKAAADEIICSNAEHAARYVLERYL